MSRRAWLVALWLYAIAAGIDMTAHLVGASRAGEDWRTASNLIVAFSASLFWPIDLVAKFLLSR